MDLEHPTVTQIRRTGYPAVNRHYDLYAIDSMGYEVRSGDEIMVLDDDLFLIEPLVQDAIEVLEILGATHEVAK